ncbi:CagC family type IV secretion system protein [Leuconostoc gasicomitatum]|jgi:hypothetical protein|uniref:CagC family type IV secretion system protein n=1 Tax=Leuconostoc gasicomitatum TaxID=115778 RepID=UPI000744BFF5|nr:CagC family type IV secretion system protein [Leuconostoc gasicomitatum]MBZ5972401.1 conjugal transfer protein [Leuconostoc gasicomitatum]CUR64595.1 Conjugal transfer protein TraB [Leuconostoc gasicomitatum KG16-1]
MKKLSKEMIVSTVTTISTVGYLILVNAPVAFASDASEVQSKLTDAGNTIKGVLTALIVLVGICVSLWIIIKRMPDADDPREKSEVYKSVGRVAGLVALSAIIVWLLPWVYSLFV